MTWTNRAPLDQVVKLALPAGTVLHRCYRLSRGVVTFWPSSKDRFAAAPRPTLYAGSSDTAAIFETLLRDPIPLPGTADLVLPFAHLRDRGLATLRLRKDAAMVSLRRPAINAVIQDPQHLADVRELIETTAGYDETVRFARELHSQVPMLDALSWPSRRADEQTAYCFYEGQFGPADLEIIECEPLFTDSGYTRLVQAVDATGLRLVRNEPGFGSTPATDDP